MGLVRNLKKRLNDWADRVLAELSSAYITQLAKQTTKKRDNSLRTTSSLNPLTTEHQSTTIVTSSPGTLEKTIMKVDSTDDIVAYIREWSIDKVESAESIGNKDAIYKEFEEWIELEDESELEIISLEPDED
tara:strand:+ start:35 stop:430 length:396 start_codon:yes stop_codon:yes gene_type:complete